MSDSDPSDEPFWNLSTPTLGGAQLWGDLFHSHGWRIQQHALTRHFRLLDPGNVRRAWGSEQQCLKAFQNCCPPQSRTSGQATGTRRCVICIHGIARSSRCFSTMRKELACDGVDTVGFDYPSTRVPIEKSAEYLRRSIASLSEVDEIDLVVHSMGGLVVRQMLKEQRDPRLRRMVMLGVPNHGANMANLVRNLKLFRLIWGPAGQQLIEDPQGFIESLPIPDFPFAIIAGGNGTTRGYNPLIPGDDDGTVPVCSTRLKGAADFLRVPVLHSFLMTNPEVIQAVRNFFRTGRLRSNAPPTPITSVGET